jgi:sulfotransferase family protein
MIVWLASFPRSGNTFFRILLHHLYELPTYSGFKSGDDLSFVGAGELTGHDTLPPELLRALIEGDHAALAPYRESEQVYAIKSHMTAHETVVRDLPTILLVRDPRDALVSYVWYLIHTQTLYARNKPLSTLLRSPRRYSHFLRLRALSGLMSLGLRDWLFRRFLRRVVRYPRWSELNDSWMDRPSREALYILRFEDLIARPREAVQEALAGVGLNVKPRGERIPDFEELQRIFPAFFRQGKIGAGRQCYSEALHEELLAVHGTTMRRLGYL